jgi:hypothetical protein
MAVPKCTYLMMKMSGLKSVITMDLLIEHTFNYDVKQVEPAEALALDKSLVVKMEKLANKGLDPPPNTPAVLRLPNRPSRCPSTLLLKDRNGEPERGGGVNGSR